MQGNIIWLTGLDNYQIDNKSLKSVCVDKGMDLSHFLTVSGEDDIFPNQYFLFQFYKYLKDTFKESIEILPGKVIDIKHDGKKIRFVTDKLSASETETYIIKAESDINIVIATRPKSITKGEIEEKITAQHRACINLPVPKSSNLLQILNPHSWTLECFMKKFMEALFGIIVGTVSNVFGTIILKMIFQ